jgi:hypothetical protein
MPFDQAPHRNLCSRLAALLTAGFLLFMATPARAEGFPNPFADHLEPHPGHLALNLQMGSVHGEGLGLAVGYMPCGYFEVKASYAYWTEHSVAGLFKFNILPRAHLTPYIPVVYTLRISSLPAGLQLLTHGLSVGAGLQVRFLERFFVAGELTANVALLGQLKDKSEHYEFAPSDEFTLRAGFLAGVYLL